MVSTLGRPELRTIGVGLYAFVGQNTTQWTLLCAAAVMSLSPTMLPFFALQHQFIDGIANAFR
jgi:ABC-type glycerol-3-phosphate transport system permease component